MDKQTPLYALHKHYGGKMTHFARHLLPLSYGGILAEHTHTRTQASLFDISHMGQLEVRAAPALLERLSPSDLEALRPGQMRYTLLLNEAGGICDDVIITRTQEGFVLVVNGACVEKDISLLRDTLGIAVEQRRWALLALQGPCAAAVLARHVPHAATLPFMTSLQADFEGVPCDLSRCGYTGEDGYEISVAAEAAVRVAQTLLDSPEVALAGLGARDSLRLEAGLCLYGQDIDEHTTPVEAGLGWTIPARRRTSADFPGAPRILSQLDGQVTHKRVGLLAEGKIPMRGGAVLLSQSGHKVGHVTSGGFSPTLQRGIAMGMLTSPHETHLTVRSGSRTQAAHVVPLPFVPHRTHSSKTTHVQDLLHTTA